MPPQTQTPTFPVQILDGGLGTTLQDHHATTFNSTTTPLWSSHLLISSPPTLLACQRAFIEAGSDVLLTATYQVSIEGFARTKTASHPDGIPRDAIAPYIRTALTVAADAVRGSNAKIALSLGPYGACMIPGQEYSGAYDAEHDDEESLFRWHLERLRLIVEAVQHNDGQRLEDKVQYVAFETVPRLDEVRAVRRAARAAGLEAMGIPFWVVCVFPVEGQDALPDGSAVEAVVEAALSGPEPKPWGIGMNCTKVHRLGRLVKLFGEGVEKVLGKEGARAKPALVLYPDGTQGEVYNTTTQVWEKKVEGPGAADSRPWEVQLAEIVNDARAGGHFSSILAGGCCKASHHDIAKLRQHFQ
ncbi:homocysteine S-methyltransferase family protein [Aspergillus brunneoviolaceus CBS 621.78]|uniref:Homocysteine S-methyltransferase n=1 Tax=Aspergillus brunneoviolaceus CBS 621.78 TaxID=1450534 RepID=A0ACD1GKU4_9EURO|nr:Homocysteine S-methyltransferase [Aspergillus brunneoviolaceus CBS 621.78]RAH49888.1 Homocysteine S-methyltransferase [Aspergillus brunneoviolaceus CBS 621.78]